MNSHSSAIRSQSLALTVLVLAAYACGTSGGGLPIVSHTPYPDSANIEGITWGSGPFVLENPTVGLADLSSYTATLTLSFDGTKNGSAQKWTKTYVMLASLDPQARILTVQKSGDLTNLDSANVAERGGAQYSWQGENTCTANVVNQGQSLSDLGEPAGFLSFVVGAEEAGSETVNDIPSNHYTFDGHALAQEDLAQSTGEVWVATDGGYVVKYLVTTTGKADYFGEGVEGTLSSDYELTAVNQPVEINIPADCPPGLVDAPQLPDATNVDNSPGMLTYESSASMADAAAFYEKELPKLGWKSSSEPIVADEDTLLNFARGSETLAIIIAIKDGKTVVTVMPGSAE